LISLHIHNNSHHCCTSAFERWQKFTWRGNKKNSKKDQREVDFSDGSRVGSRLKIQYLSNSFQQLPTLSIEFFVLENVINKSNLTFVRIIPLSFPISISNWEKLNGKRSTMSFNGIKKITTIQTHSNHLPNGWRFKPIFFLVTVQWLCSSLMEIPSPFSLLIHFSSHYFCVTNGLLYVTFSWHWETSFIFFFF
jgi:hypothetical protein